MLGECRDAISTVGRYLFTLQPKWELKAGRQFLVFLEFWLLIWGPN